MTNYKLRTYFAGW